MITIGLEVLAQPVNKARVAALYTYTVQTNAPAGDTSPSRRSRCRPA